MDSINDIGSRKRSKFVEDFLREINGENEVPVEKSGEELDHIPRRFVNEIELEQSTRLQLLIDEDIMNQDLYPDEIIVEVSAVNRRNSVGWTCLHTVVCNEDMDEAQKLVKLSELVLQGADPSIRDNAGATAFDKAKLNGYTQIASYLSQFNRQ